MKTLILLLAVAVLSGCAMGKVHETTSADGTGEFTSWYFVPPFSKMAEASTSLDRRKTKTTTSTKIGAGATGVDNTGEIAAMDSVVQAAVQGVLAGMGAKGVPIPPLP